MTLPDQGLYWADKAGDWTETADAMAFAASRFNTLLCDRAGLRPGMRVLDLASGPGEPALTAGARVGTDGLVVATDILAAMLATTRARGLAAGAPIVCAAADMAALPFPPGLFDATLCRFGLMFAPDPVATLRGIASVLKPAGTLAVMAWGPRANTTILDVLCAAVTASLPAAPEDEALDAVFAHGAPGTLDWLFAQAGFHDREEQTHDFAPLLPADTPFWRPQLRMTFGHLLRHFDAKARDRLDQDILTRLAPYREETATGFGYRLGVRVVTCVGQIGR